MRVSFVLRVSAGTVLSAMNQKFTEAELKNIVGQFDVDGIQPLHASPFVVIYCVVLHTLCMHRFVPSSMLCGCGVKAMVKLIFPNLCR